MSDFNVHDDVAREAAHDYDPEPDWAAPTAAELKDSYEGGIDLRPVLSGAVEGTLGWKSRFGTVHMIVALDGAMKGFAQTVIGLSCEEWLEFRHAGDEAFAAAARAIELREGGQ